VAIEAKMAARPATPGPRAEESPVRVEVNPNICEGHGQCNAVAPEIYDLDDGGYCLIRNPEVPAGLEPQAEEGALACPVQAITVTP
jgi:ferredoxin